MTISYKKKNNKIINKKIKIYIHHTYRNRYLFPILKWD